MSDPVRRQPQRLRDAEQTRATILVAAQKCFSQQGYDQVGVRDIAALAGFNAALIIRYFGSKENLFTVAVTQAFQLGDLLEENKDNFGERLVRYLVEEGTNETFYPLLALLRSAPSPQGAFLLRQGLEEQFIHPLARWLGGEQAVLRASLIASILLGLAVTRDVIQSDPLATSSVEVLISSVSPIIQAYVTGIPS